MLPNWQFKPYYPGDTYRNSTADAFFDSDTVSDPGKALVREGIQNSLDANKIHPDNPVLVRISLINQDTAPSWVDVEKYFGTAWPHYTSERSGLHPDEIPSHQEKCTALVFEDMDTTGLLGDVEEWREPEEGNRNDFFNFFRAEALTHKSPGDRGSRGVGKATFIQASRVNTLFGLTIRHNDRRPLLMGRSVLRSHRLGGHDHHGDGYFGIPSSVSDGLISPIEDRNLIDEFIQSFRLERREESGLSVVVPWPDKDIDEETIIRAVCENYFYTILNEGLAVLVELPENLLILDRSSLSQEVQKDEQLSRLLPVVNLAEWATQGDVGDERHVLNPHPGTGTYTWTRSLFPEGLLDTLREELQRQQRFVVRVPVPVRKRGTAPQDSYFDVYIASDDSNYGTAPAFVREDILIADVRPRSVRDGIRALVVIDHEPLASFLRQAENPSHTQWQQNLVKKDYIQAPSLVSFIVNSVREICNLASAENREVDKRLLADIFPLPDIGEDSNGVDNGGTNGNGGNGHPSDVRINSINGGFSVTPTHQSFQPGDRVDIKVAYARSRGDAFARYRTTDFQVDQKPITLESLGVELTEVVNNRIVARVTSPQFRIAVTGFDENRDIRVRADKIRGADAGS